MKPGREHQRGAARSSLMVHVEPHEQRVPAQDEAPIISAPTSGAAQPAWPAQLALQAQLADGSPVDEAPDEQHRRPARAPRQRPARSVTALARPAYSTTSSSEARRHVEQHEVRHRQIGEQRQDDTGRRPQAQPAAWRQAAAAATQRSAGRGGRARTRDIRFWRSALYQLSYAPGYAVVRSYTTGRCGQRLTWSRGAPCACGTAGRTSAARADRDRCACSFRSDSCALYSRRTPA